MQITIGAAQKVLLLLGNSITECKPTRRHCCTGTGGTASSCKGDRTACWHCMTLALLVLLALQVLWVGIDSCHSQHNLCTWLGALRPCSTRIG
jgi:hypothetical protein